MNTHADKTRENKSQTVPNAIFQKMSRTKFTFQFVNNRPEAVVQRKLQEMVNNSPKAKQLEAYQEMTSNSPQTKRAAQLQAMVGNNSSQQQQPIQKVEEGGTGTNIGNRFRLGINAIASFFGGLNQREHNYSIEPTPLGRVVDIGSAEEVRQRLLRAPVGLTVPGAVKGRGGELFGPREEGGTAYAFLGGPVTMKSDPESSTISNVVQEGHLFGGRVDQTFFEQDGVVMTRIVGSGYGNFARINEVVGRPLFSFMARTQRSFLSTPPSRGTGSTADE